VIAHLFAQELTQTSNEEKALLKVIKKLKGSFACAVLIEGQERLYGISRGSPLVVGRTGQKMALASDGLALADWADEIIYLDDSEFVILEKGKLRLFNFEGKTLERSFEKLDIDDDRVSKEGHIDFMHKEIHEQPQAIQSALSHYLSNGALNFPKLPNQEQISNILMIGCGGSIHAAQTARYWLAKYARLPAHEEVASEFRDRHAVIPQDTLLVFISQSGETADTLAAFRHCLRQGHASVAIVNQARSTLARSADKSLMMFAGTEIGVASTKCLTAQMVLLALMTLHLAKISKEEKQKHIKALEVLPEKMHLVLDLEAKLEKIAEQVLMKAGYILYLGRGAFFPIALEGALKMKEITYIPSEGYAAGEMKHGPIAMIDSRTPIIVLAPYNELFPKTLSNLQEAHARGGQIILISDKRGIAEAQGIAAHVIEFPEIDDFTAPILYVLAVQFLSYHTARLKGLDVDRPRNLAKSVTVE
jgi:glucosamine--fructose-6-phosphate aminotransferase (isomerizing)